MSTTHITLPQVPLMHLSPLVCAPRKHGVRAHPSATVPIIAICHLSWDWVWQRPQQFLSRMAQTHPLLFVETHPTGHPQSFYHLRTLENNPSIRILQLFLPQCRWSDAAYMDHERRRIVRDILLTPECRQFQHAILWINDPMAAASFTGHLGECMIVYDCMDELSQFAGAPPGIAAREHQLIRAADVIFCGGQKMRRKRLPHNSNTHFYGTGVDCAHFGQAINGNLQTHADIAALPGRVLGYFGVIDERIDYDLLAKLADAEPSWSIAMIGPFAKIDCQQLPRRRNLHWLGGRSYDELPAMTRGMEVCLMPFALNAATEYINPTKALEYLAAGKPVVSTALDEVRMNFSVAVRIARSHDHFIELCRAELRSPSRHRIRRGLKLAAESTWEKIVARMNGHIEEVLAARRGSTGVPARVAPAPASATPAAYV